MVNLLLPRVLGIWVVVIPLTWGVRLVLVSLLIVVGLGVGLVRVVTPPSTVTERLWVSTVLRILGPLLTMRTLNVLREWTGLHLLISALTITRLRHPPPLVLYRVLCEVLDGLKLSDRQMEYECEPRLGIVI